MSDNKYGRLPTAGGKGSLFAGQNMWQVAKEKINLAELNHKEEIMKIQNNIKGECKAPTKTVNKEMFTNVQNCLGGMQGHKGGLIYVQNDDKELCLLNIDDGSIVDKVFHVNDYKQDALNAINQAIY